jgi:hypothetical protein
MKTTMLFIAVLVLSLSAFGQVASSGQQAAYSNTVQMAEHPMHADHHDLRPEVSLLGGTSITEGHGERPLWEFPDNTPVKPLGDIARQYREEHKTAEKAIIVWAP